MGKHRKGSQVRARIAELAVMSFIRQKKLNIHMKRIAALVLCILCTVPALAPICLEASAADTTEDYYEWTRIKSISELAGHVSKSGQNKLHVLIRTTSGTRYVLTGAYINDEDLQPYEDYGLMAYGYDGSDSFVTRGHMNSYTVTYNSWNGSNQLCVYLYNGNGSKIWYNVDCWGDGEFDTKNMTSWGSYTLDNLSIKGYKDSNERGTGCFGFYYDIPDHVDEMWEYDGEDGSIDCTSATQDNWDCYFQIYVGYPKKVPVVNDTYLVASGNTTIWSDMRTIKGVVCVEGTLVINTDVVMDGAILVYNGGELIMTDNAVVHTSIDTERGVECTDEIKAFDDSDLPPNVIFDSRYCGPGTISMGDDATWIMEEDALYYAYNYLSCIYIDKDARAYLNGTIITPQGMRVDHGGLVELGPESRLYLGFRPNNEAIIKDIRDRSNYLLQSVHMNPIFMTPNQSYIGLHVSEDDMNGGAFLGPDVYITRNINGKTYGYDAIYEHVWIANRYPVSCSGIDCMLPSLSKLNDYESIIGKHNLNGLGSGIPVPLWIPEGYL